MIKCWKSAWPLFLVFFIACVGNGNRSVNVTTCCQKCVCGISCAVVYRMQLSFCPLHRWPTSLSATRPGFSKRFIKLRPSITASPYPDAFYWSFPGQLSALELQPHWVENSFPCRLLYCPHCCHHIWMFHLYTSGNIGNYMIIGSDTQRGASAIYHGSARSGWALSVFRVRTALCVQSQRSANIFFSWVFSAPANLIPYVLSLPLRKEEACWGQGIISIFMHLI